MQETRMGQEDTLEKEMATHSSILACLENPRQRSLAEESMGLQELDMT